MFKIMNMKTRKIYKYLAALVFVVFAASCETPEAPEPMGDAGQTLVKLFPADFKLIALDAVSTAQKSLMFDVRRDAQSEAALNSSATAVLTVSDAILTAYNTAHKTSFIPLPTSLATTSPAPAADGKITLNFAPGEFAKSIIVTIPDATKFDFSKQYALGYKLSLTTGDAILSKAVNTEVVVQVLVKNKYDGIYEVTANSPMVDVLNATLTGYYPFIYVLETSGAHSVKCFDRDIWGDYMHPITSGTSVSGYGSFGLEVFFDPSGNGKIIDVKNPWGNPPANTRMPAIDPSGVNTWNPATKKILFKYFMKQPSLVPAAPNVRVFFDETWTYKGPR
jgi:hypothetical protein